MKKAVILGAGNVGRVVAYKCAQAPEAFDEVHIARRNLKELEKLRDDIKRDTGREVIPHELDADKSSEVANLLKKIQPDIAVNTALPYQNIPIMEACLEERVNYMDTAISEDRGKFKPYNYKWQKAFHNKFKEKGITGVLGLGFDPGATNVMCKYAEKNLFDMIETIDILDCNAGDHGQDFMPNFNPEINLREVTQNATFWQKDKGWVSMPSIVDENALHAPFEFPVVGKKMAYLLGHEEEMSLVKNIRGMKRIRFWMTFTDKYINRLDTYKKTGLTSTVPIFFKGHWIQPLEFLCALFPKSAEVAERYTGKTAIGCIFNGTKDGKKISKYLYQICDHEESYKETGIHAIAYTTGVPAMIGAMLIANGTWKKAGVYHPEQFDPDPFMAEMNKRGLPWQVVDGEKYLKSLPK